MKHGLKQQIKRGLSVLMAASMVASSALPVMAEEVVEEAVEVEVVSEEVADVEDDVVVDVAEETEAVEEVLEYEEVVEDSANIVTDGPSGNYDQTGDAHQTHLYDYKKGTLNLKLDDNGDPKEAYVDVFCEYGHTVTSAVSFPTLPTVPGYTNIVVDPTHTYALAISANNAFEKETDCKLKKDKKATYQLYVIPAEDKDDLFDAQGNLSLSDNDTTTLKECVRSESDVVSSEEYTKAWKHTMPTNANAVTVQPTCMTLGEATYLCTVCGEAVKDEPVPMLQHKWYTNGIIYWADDASDAWMIFTCQNGPEDDAHKTGKGHNPHTMKISLKDFIREYEYEAAGDALSILRPTCSTPGHVYYVVDADADDIKKLLGFRKQSATLEDDDIFVDANGNEMADSYINNNYLNFTVDHAKLITLKPTGHKVADVSFDWAEFITNPSGSPVTQTVADAMTISCEVTVVCTNANCELSRKSLKVLPKNANGTEQKVQIYDETTQNYVDTTLVTGYVEEIAAKRQNANCGGDDEQRFYHAVVKVGGTTYDSCDKGKEYNLVIKNENPAAHHSYDVAGATTLEKAIPGTVTSQPTCTTKGSGTFACTNPGCTERAVKDILPLGHDIVPNTTYLSESTCATEAVLNGQCQRCKKHVDVRPAPLGIPYKLVTQTTIGEIDTNGKVIDGLFAEDYAKITVKDSKAHKFEIGTVVWAKDLKSVSVQVKCVCGADTDKHTTGELIPASGETKKLADGECTFTLTAVPTIEKEATGFETGKMHYEAAVKFTDDFGKAQDLGTLKSKSVEIPATGEKTVTTITVNAKTVTYTGDRQKADVVTNGPKATVRYYKDAAMTQQYSGEPYTAGTYYVKATVAEGEKYTAAEATGTLVIKKADPKVTVTPATKTVKNTKKNTVSIKVTQKNKGGQTGKVTYTARSSKIKVSSKGVVTVAKGTKKGTYRVDVTVKATTNYNAYTKTIKITVK